MDRQLTVSYGTVDITPLRPAVLGGYEKRCVPFKGIADRLEANVLIIQGPFSNAVIVSADLLYPGERLRSQLLENLGLGDRSAELFLCASHTHYAPMTATSMPHLGEVDSAYLRYISEQITELIRSVWRHRVPCQATYHEGEANHSMNRRLVCLRLTKSGLRRSVGLGPNPAGERDETVRILKFSKLTGEPLAIVWNYACHPSDFFDSLRVSAAYPGQVRSRLRSQLGDIPVLFFQGFSGNLRPPFTGMSPGIKGVTRRILLGPQFKRSPGRQDWERWTNSLADAVTSFACSESAPLALSPPIVKRIEVPENRFAIGGIGDKSLSWHVIDCGGFRIVGINAEPVTEYRRFIEKYLAGAPFLTVGCLDQTHCYLPSDAMIAERGYEVEGFRALFGFKPQFREQLQDSVIEGLRQALSQ